MTHNNVEIARSIHDSSEVRIALNALRQSPDFAALKGEKVWLLSTANLRQRLEDTHCNSKCHWYMVLTRIMRFHESATVRGGVIAVDALRNFLCDYVFGVPREEFQ